MKGEKNALCLASSSAGQVSLSKHWVNALADPKPTQGDSQLLHAGFARDEWRRTGPSHPLWCPHTSSTLLHGDSRQAAFFFFSPYFFSITLSTGPAPVWMWTSPPSFICILEQMLEVFSGEARCKRLYDGGTQSSPAGGILADTSRRPTCTCPYLTYG